MIEGVFPDNGNSSTYITPTSKVKVKWNNISFNGGKVDVSSFSFSIYPNPADSEININAQKVDSSKTELKPFEVYLYDEFGNLLHSHKIENQNHKIPVSNLRKGFYYIVILHEGGQTRKKILISR